MRRISKMIRIEFALKVDVNDLFASFFLTVDNPGKQRAFTDLAGSANGQRNAARSLDQRLRLVISTACNIKWRVRKNSPSTVGMIVDTGTGSCR